jgi:PAS domain S-box-containing protein
MDTQPGELVNQIEPLQRCINDLASVTLPAIWSGAEPPEIVHTLLDALLGMLQLDFVYVWLHEANGQSRLEMARFAQSKEQLVYPHEFGGVLKQWLGAAPHDWPPLIRKPLGDRDISIVPLGLGLQGEIGVILAGSERSDFPQQTERLILSVAASQASIGLQEARLLSEQKRIADELERRVSERTASLEASNEALKTEIADHKHAEEALKSSEEKHRVIVEAASDAIVNVDDNGTIRFVNPATARIFGYAPTELTAKPLTLLMPESMRGLHDNGFRRYLATGHRHINWQGTELIALRKNGQEFPVEVSFGELTRDGHKEFTGFIRDISQRKQAEEMLAAQTSLALIRADVSLAFGREENLEAVLHECAESMVRHLGAAFSRIWTLNRETEMLELRASAGLYTHLNGAHARIPIGKLKIGMIAQEQKPILTNDLINDPLISDKAWAAKEGMAGFAGHPLVVGTRALGVMAVFSRKPLTTGTIEILASIAGLVAQGIERKRAEDELRASERRLEEMESELARVARLTTMGELAASIAHEVNQPLTAIVNNSSACLRLLANRNLEPDVLRRALEEIVADGARASSVLARIRAFIKKEPSEKSELNVNDVIQEVLVLASRELNDHQVLPDHKLKTDLPSVLADRVQLQQVLLNLIINGMEAMAAVTDRPRLLEVQSRTDESGRVLVSISDSGTGLGLGADRVFTPFFTTKTSGMGMGLSISRSLIESHGGRLWAAPNSPHGAVFSFTLPAADGGSS